ncbi:MAG: hypothetical protein HIU89_05530 [Proteobacteria bacterium]|nr:hypothetical protein [Pseudomonadota bacterium]
MLAYLALLLDAAQDSEADRAVLAEFLGEHLQPWAQTFVNLLAQAQSPYISQLGAMLRDLFDTVCEAFPPMMPKPFIAAPKHIPIQVE